MKGSQPREKESVMTVVPCTLGKVRNWDTVDDSVRSHMNHKKERRIHRLLLRQIQLNSDEKGSSVTAVESSDSSDRVHSKP